MGLEYTLIAMIGDKASINDTAKKLQINCNGSVHRCNAPNGRFDR
jgi:hypothetical protein